MKQHTKNILLIIFCIVFFLSADAQKNKPQNTKPVSKKEIPPPPPMEEIQEVKIDTLSALEEPPADAPTEIPEPQIDFDTTSVPDDEFTQDILQLLEVSNAMNFGQSFAKGMAKPEEQNELLKEFYKRFFHEMKEGDAYKWMLNLFVKSYRQRYTREEIQELVKFYQTPLGKKVIKETAEMLPAVMKEGEKIGKYLGARIMNEILNEKKDN